MAAVPGTHFADVGAGRDRDWAECPDAGGSGADTGGVTRRTAVWAALICAQLVVIVVLALAALPIEAPWLWLLVVAPAAAGFWFLRQAVKPDQDAPTRWRVRNALGCLFAGMGVPVLIMIPVSEIPFLEFAVSESADQQGLGLLVVLGILAALGAIATLLWGTVEWVVSAATRA